jgi:hypothetical protein
MISERDFKAGSKRLFVSLFVFGIGGMAGSSVMEHSVYPVFYFAFLSFLPILLSPPRTFQYFRTPEYFGTPTSLISGLSSLNASELWLFIKLF